MNMKNKNVGSANEYGFALVATMIVLFLIMVLGVSVFTTTSLNNLIAIHDKSAKRDFYNQEYCLGSAQVNSSTWLTSAYLEMDEKTAYFPKSSETTSAQCLDSDGDVIGTYKVRNILDTDVDISDWEDIDSYSPSTHPANSYPPYGT
jgi:Tfp pilus assembly protein PilX